MYYGMKPCAMKQRVLYWQGYWGIKYILVAKEHKSHGIVGFHGFYIYTSTNLSRWKK